MLLQLVCQGIRQGHAFLDGDKRCDRLSFDVVWPADDGGRMRLATLLDALAGIAQELDALRAQPELRARDAEPARVEKAVSAVLEATRLVM